MKKITLAFVILLVLTASAYVALARPPRPELAPPVYHRYKPHLIVHYTKTGPD